MDLHTCNVLLMAHDCHYSYRLVKVFVSDTKSMLVQCNVVHCVSQLLNTVHLT